MFVHSRACVNCNALRTFIETTLDVTIHEILRKLAVIQSKIFFLPISYKKLKIKINKTVILSVALHVCETWSLSLREEQRLRVSENRGGWYESYRNNLVFIVVGLFRYRLSPETFGYTLVHPLSQYAFMAWCSV
jgi:hypothetical protein